MKHIPPCARITLRKASTGQTVSFIDDWTKYDWYKKAIANGKDTADYGTLVFEWEENNHACDSNRERCFYHALGEDCPEEEDGPHYCMRIGPHKDYEYQLLMIDPVPPKDTP